jgi:hypothetical protein
LLALDCKAHPANEHRAVSCQRAKQQEVRDISWVFNVERRAWLEHEEVGRSSAENGAKKARTEPADQRSDYNCGKERNELGAHNIWIDAEPQRRSSPGGHESEGGGSDSSRPQRGDIDIK